MKTTFPGFKLRTIGQISSLRSTLCWILATCLLVPVLLAQSNASGLNKNQAEFAGTWKGVCQDGKAFILLALRPGSSGLEGTVSLGNFSFGDPDGSKGTCTVADAADPKHSKVIHDASVEGQKLTFDTFSGRVAMELTGEQTAKLWLLGTPEADSFFEVRKSGS